MHIVIPELRTVNRIMISVRSNFTCWMTIVLVIATASAASAQSQLKIEVSSILEGDSNWDGTQARTTFVPVGAPFWLTTMSRTAKKGPHGDHDVFLSLSRDHGQTWSKLTVVPSLQRTEQPDGYEIVAGDLWPKWHAATGTVLLTGKTFNFADGVKENILREKVAYAVFDPSTHECGPQRTIEMPKHDHEGKPFIAPNAGCHQRVDLVNGEILLPIRYQKSSKKRNYTTIVARCRNQSS